MSGLSLGLGLGLGFGRTSGPGTIIIPASSRNFGPASTITTAGGVAGGTNAVQKHKNNTTAQLKNFRLQHTRVGYDSAMSLIRANANIQTFRAALEKASVRNQMFRGGSADFILQTSEDSARGDVLSIVGDPAEVLTLRTWEDVPASTTRINYGGTTLATLGEVFAYGGIASQPDRTMSGSPTAANSSNSASAWLLAEAPVGTKSMLIVDDSIGAGLNETTAFTSDADGNIGAPNRWAALHGYNTINIAKPSSRASQWAANDLSVMFSLLSGITFDTLWVGLGRNDYAAGQTAAQIKASVETVISRFKTQFPSIVRVIVRDLTPTTTSTDSWATVANQTIGNAGQEAVRVSYNATVAAKGITGQTDYFAFAPSCQALKVDGTTIVWPASGTTDGIHPTGAINATAVAANNWN